MKISFLFILILFSQSSFSDVTEEEFVDVYANQLEKCMNENHWNKKTKNEKIEFQQVPSSQWAVVNPEGDLEGFKKALGLQIENCKKKDQLENLKLGPVLVPRKKWCTESNELMLKMASQPDVKTFKDLLPKIKDKFNFYLFSGEDSKGNTQLTGYNSPKILGSRVRTDKFKYPIYSTPSDLVQVEENGQKVWKLKRVDGSFSPYYDRETIEKLGKLKDKSKVIAYLADPIELYYLQVEGAGTIELPDKKNIFVNYAANNGQKYISLGNYMSCVGVPSENLSLEGTKQFFKKNPKLVSDYLNQNPSYIFFKEVTKGALAANGEALTPKHSLAVDNSLIGYGALALVQTKRPDEKNPKNKIAFTTLAIAQDTGSDIKGNHIDFFWGSDEYSKLAASQMNETGSVFIAVAK